MRYPLHIFFVLLVLSLMAPDVYSQKNKNKKGNKKSVNTDLKSSEKFRFAFGEAMRHKISNDIQTAEVIFKECIKLNPNEPAPYFELSQIYMKYGEGNLALESAKKAVEINPENYWYQINLAEAYQKLGRINEAIGIFEILVEKYPHKESLMDRLGAMYVYTKNHKKVIELYNKLEERVGIIPEFIILKKQAYLGLGDVEKAAMELRKLIKENPDDENGYFRLADLYSANEMDDEAFKLYQELLKRNPNSGKTHLFLANYYEKNGQNAKSFDELELAFKDQDLDIDTKIKILLSYYGEMQKSDKYKKEILRLNEVLVDVHPNEAKSHTIYADFLYNERRLVEAKHHFGKAIQLDESKFAIWNQYLIIEIELNQFDSVLIHSEQATEIFPNQPAFYYFSGLAYARNKDYDKAIRKYTSGKKLIVDNPVLLMQFYINLGEVYNEKKDYADSDAAFEEALKIDPNNANALNNYSFYLSLRGENLEKAEKMSAKSNELEKNQSYYMDTYAWIMYKQKRYAEAKEWIEKALKARGGNGAEVLEHAGDIYYHLDNLDKALEYWKKAQKGDGETSPLLEKKIRDKKLYE